MNDLNIVLGKQVLITALKKDKILRNTFKKCKPCTLKTQKKKQTTERN